MQPFKHLVFYALIILIFGAGVWSVLYFGDKILSSHVTTVDQSETSLELPPTKDAGSIDPIGIYGTMRHYVKNLRHPVGVFLLQMLIIVTACTTLGAFFHKVGQPTVIGEIVAGIILGPSFFGWLFPELFSFVFPSGSLNALQLLSRVGVLLFMFVVGMELDLKVLKEKSHSAVLVSHASIIFPFFLGMLTALFLYNAYAPVKIPFWEFSLFMGIAMSITAFPVLARILDEGHLVKTPLGSMAMAAAAVDDITAWSVLAIIVASVQSSSPSVGVYTILFSILFVSFMLLFVRPFIERMLSDWHTGEEEENLERRTLSVVLILIVACALFTRCIGIHSLFGAFMAGTIIPNNEKLKSFFRNRLAYFSTLFLLPLFFVHTGLRTQIGLITSAKDWIACGIIIAAATLGKFGGGTVAAKFSGMSWRESLGLGALMNTRGLMELVVLNIGLDLGILSPPIFAMMVLMALVTTFMTSPLLRVFGCLPREKP